MYKLRFYRYLLSKIRCTNYRYIVYDTGLSKLDRSIYIVRQFYRALIARANFLQSLSPSGNFIYLRTVQLYLIGPSVVTS